MRLFIFEGPSGIWIGRVEGKSVRQNNCHRVNRVIGIFDHTATHATGVIREDASHHAGIDRGRVGSDTTTEGLEYIVDKSADNAGLEANQMTLILHSVFSPML